MNLRHALRDARWWYRTTFKQWFEGPEYAECPDCGGPVYHNSAGDPQTLVEYRCRDCGWHHDGTTEFDFYLECHPGLTAWDVFAEHRKLVCEHGPDEPDPEAFAEWAENGGLESVSEQMREKFDDAELRAAVEFFEQAHAHE